MHVSVEFDRSYRDFESYPHNLVQKDLDVSAADVCAACLQRSVPRLLIEKEKRTKVRFRDLCLQNGGIEMKEDTLCSDGDIRNWLGDTTQNAGIGALPAGEVATYQDPQCRLIYLSGATSRAPLNITKQSLTRLLGFHQVMPVYVELLDSVLGRTEETRNPTYFAFRDRVFLDGADHGHQMPALARSGKHFQMAYILKSIACTSAADGSAEDQQWSPRSAAFYHQFDVETATALWMIAYGRDDLYTRAAKVTEASDLLPTAACSMLQNSTRQALRSHLCNATWAADGWRKYVEWFEIRIKKETQIAVYKPARETNRTDTYTGEQLNLIQILEEKLNEAIILIEGNLKTLKTLRIFYSNLATEVAFDQSVARRMDLTMFDKSLEQISSMFDSALIRAKYQSQLASQRKALVLQHLQDQNIAKTETLALDTRRITIEAQHEAVVMRIITIVTLIYLPATFVSTFFSTDVIKYQNEVQFSEEAMYRWLQVTLPLTLITFLVAGWFFWRSWTQTQDQKVNIRRTEMNVGTGNDEKMG